MSHPCAHRVIPFFVGIVAALWTCSSVAASGDLDLFATSENGDVVLRPAAIVAARSATDGLQVSDFPLADGTTARLNLERFTVTDAGTRFVTGRDGRSHAFDASRVVLLRGAVPGEPDSRAFLAVSDLGVAGYVDLGPGRGRHVLVGAEATGLVTSGIHSVLAGAGGAPPLPDVCGVPAAPGDLVIPPAPAGPVGEQPDVLRQLQIAVETDYEYYELFGDVDQAAAYIVALYGAISDIYVHDLDVRITLTFVRIWDDPDDLFNDDNPLQPFRNYWNEFMTDVERDVAQFLTGRRNLPYGGVAWVSALCGESAYSVCGYILGSFTDPQAPSGGNWDIVVTAHELGHNCGTFHTHDYGIDECASGDVQRGTIMSYCHTSSGGTANIDMRFHTGIQSVVAEYIPTALCVVQDCNGNDVPDAEEIELGQADDENGNGIPDDCEDCNENDVLDDVDIAIGTSDDLDGNGIPDECEPDCNGNGVPDALDIASLTSLDAYGNGIPDECEADCNDDGTADYNEIQADMALDLDRNAVLDGCQDCNDDGTLDFDDLGGGLNLWVAGSTMPFVREHHALTGVPVKDSEAGLEGCRDVLAGPDGSVLVACFAQGRIARIDPVTGDLMPDLVGPLGGLGQPAAMAIGPDGTLFVADWLGARVARFDAASGASLGDVVRPGSGGLVDPSGLAFDAAGDLYVSSGDDRVLRYDSRTGTFLGAFVAAGSGGLDDPRGLLFKPDGDLLVASFGSSAVLAYDGETGAFIDQWDRGGLNSGFWALANPWGLRLHPRGDAVLVSSNAGNASVHAYALDSGLFLRSFYVLASDVPDFIGPTGFAILSAGDLDCNMNLLPDDCDIASGASEDGNGNGVPDECESIPADLNGDGLVDGADLGILLGSWGPCDGCPADLNGDGAVDGADLGLLLGAWT